MVRPDSVLHDVPVAQWSRDEVYSHLKRTFDDAVDQRPDLMEPYIIRLEGQDESGQIAVMREGLRETFKLRYPSTRKAGRQLDNGDDLGHGPA